MARYHLSPKTGKPQICAASKMSCPFGEGETKHFPNKAAALKAQERQLSNDYGWQAERKVKEQKTAVEAEKKRAIEDAREKAKANPMRPGLESVPYAWKARNEHGRVRRGYFEKTTPEAQLALVQKVRKDLKFRLEPMDKDSYIPLKGDVILENKILYEVSGHYHNGIVKAEPLIATKGNDRLWLDGKVVSNLKRNPSNKGPKFILATEEEQAERAKMRKDLAALRIEREAEAERAIKEVKESVDSLVGAPELNFKELQALAQAIDDKMAASLSDPNFSNPNRGGRLSGSYMIHSAIRSLDSKGKISASSKAHALAAGFYDEDLYKFRETAGRQKYAEETAKEFSELPELEQPKSPSFFSKVFNRNADEEYTKELSEYSETIRLIEENEAYAKDSKALSASVEAYTSIKKHGQNPTLAQAYGAIAVSEARAIIESENMIGVDDRVALRQIMSSHLPEAFKVSSDTTLTPEDSRRLESVLSNILKRVEDIRKRSGVVTVAESKKSIDFLEIKFGSSEAF